MSDLAEHDATDSNNAPTTAANVRPFDSKFSKSFRRQIRKYVDKVYKVYMKKFKKPRDLNNYERDFFWVVITYIINRKVGTTMDIEDIKSQYFRKHSSQQKSRMSKINDKRRLVKKIMK
ncbi:hypothetical protein TYRP_005912 [Tyrophagus putrescentiae]|nr:hypothetical protein TYRP_005912 [Tyrophagus putrescentiae]